MHPSSHRTRQIFENDGDKNNQVGGSYGMRGHSNHYRGNGNRGHRNRNRRGHQEQQPQFFAPTHENMAARQNVSPAVVIPYPSAAMPVDAHGQPLRGVLVTQDVVVHVEKLSKAQQAARAKDLQIPSDLPHWEFSDHVDCVKPLNVLSKGDFDSGVNVSIDKSLPVYALSRSRTVSKESDDTTATGALRSRSSSSSKSSPRSGSG